MDRQLQRLMDLTRKTGDRLIVFDPDNKENAYVVMDIDEYERMAVKNNDVRGLTEGELLDKINRDIAVWKSDKIEENSAYEINKKEDEGLKFYDEDNFAMEDYDDDFEEEDDNWHSIEDIRRKSDLSGNKAKKEPERKKGAWRIPSDRQENAEEIIEEDRYYLESLED